MFTADSRELLYTWGGPGAGGFGSAVLQVSSGQERLRFTKHDNTVISGAISPDGTMAATAGGSSNEIYLWRLADASSLHRLAGKGHAAWSAGWSPDGKSIAWGNTYKFTSYNDRGPLERSFTLADLEFGPSPDAAYRRARESRGSLSLQLTGPTSLEVKQAGCRGGEDRSAPSLRADSQLQLRDGRPRRGGRRLWTLPLRRPNRGTGK